MIRAYNKDYLQGAMENLGESFDFAFYGQELKLNQFMTLFINSKVSSQFQSGNPKYVSGMSGKELVLEVMTRSGVIQKKSEENKNYSKTAEYWTGWVLAYYQWHSAKSFAYIQGHLPAEEICSLYNPLHEASEQKFIEVADSIIARRDTGSKLQIFRKNAELTQKQLSELSGVNLRTLQQYENKSKDIKKASGLILYSLGKALGCQIEDLLE